MIINITMLQKTFILILYTKINSKKSENKKFIYKTLKPLFIKT